MEQLKNTRLQSIKLAKWRQFENIDINFHPTLTIITGKNGSGKSTILYLISKYFGWNLDFVSLPKKNKTRRIVEFLTGVWNPNEQSINSQVRNIGKVIFSNNKISNLNLPDKTGASFYQITPNPVLQIKGLHIHSHRPVFKYEQIVNVPTTTPSRGQMYQEYNSQVLKRFLRGNQNNRTAFRSLKEKLISLAIFGEGNSTIISDQVAKDTFFKFQEILKIVLPKKIGFEKITITVPEVILQTKSGDFAIDAVSGGLASLIHTAWQIFLYSETEENFVVTYDEPENHLHPELQKEIIPNLIKAFPNVQFIVVTHNPLVISSVQDSFIYVFDYNSNNRVISKKIDNYEKSGSSNEILRQVLGMDTTMPNWAESKINAIIKKYLQENLTTEKLSAFKDEITEQGLTDYLSESMDKLIDKAKEDDKVE